MSFITKRQKNTAIIATVVYLFLILIAAQLLYIRGLDQLKPIYVFNISGDIFAMLAGYVLFICCIIDVQKTGSNLKWLLYLLNAAFLGTFCDAVAWLVDGVEKYIWLNVLDNTLYYMCAPFEAFFFWNYAKTFLEVDKKSIKLADIGINVGLAIALFMRVTNLFTGVYFTVSAEGIYSRSQYYGVSMIYAFGGMIVTLVMIILERKHLQVYQVVTFFMYGLAPLVVSALTLPIYGISVISGVVMLVILLMYCVLNVMQGREKAAAERDMTLAKGIQENVLPRIFPPFPERKEFDLYASMTAAREVGGDFYDFYLIDDDHIALTIADVSGKGVPAALFMMIAKTILKNQTLADSGEKPGLILEKVNDQLCDGNMLEMFVTVWLGVLTISTGSLAYANAGHEYPIIRRRGGKFVVDKEKHSPPLATMEGLHFREGEMTLNPGDCMYLYTDGVTEAMNMDKKLFGEDRLVDALNIEPNASARKLDDNIRKEISSFVKDAPQFDDITMLTFRYFGEFGKSDN